MDAKITHRPCRSTPTERTAYHDELRANRIFMRKATTFLATKTYSDGTEIEFYNCSCGCTLNIILNEGED